MGPEPCPGWKVFKEILHRLLPQDDQADAIGQIKRGEEYDRRDPWHDHGEPDVGANFDSGERGEECLARDGNERPEDSDGDAASGGMAVEMPQSGLVEQMAEASQEFSTLCSMRRGNPAAEKLFGHPLLLGFDSAAMVTKKSD